MKTEIHRINGRTFFVWKQAPCKAGAWTQKTPKWFAEEMYSDGTRDYVVAWTDTKKECIDFLEGLTQ